MATPGGWCSVYFMLYDVIRQLFYFVVPLLLFVSVWVKQNTVTLYSRHTFTRNLQTAHFNCCTVWLFNPFTPNDPYSGRTPPLTSKRCILYIYSTNTDTEYFKHVLYSPSFPLQNAVCFRILTYLVPVVFTFYIQYTLTFKKIIPAPKGWFGCWWVSMLFDRRWAVRQ